MASIISAGTTTGTAIAISGDTTGDLAFQTKAGLNTITVPNATGTMMVSGNMPAFSAYVLNGSSNYSLPNNTYTKVRYDTEFFDTANCFDTTNYRFTPNVAGYYFVTAKVFISYSSVATGRIRIALYKNGSIQKFNSMTTGNVIYENMAISSLIYMNGTTDYLEAFSFQNSSSDAVVVQGSQENEFSAYLARSA